MLENHCVSLEIAKQLKEAGWKKETEFWWCETIGGTTQLTNYAFFKKLYPAPLSTEILEELPVCLFQDTYEPYYLEMRKVKQIDIYFYEVEYRSFDTLRKLLYRESENTLPNALAKMWLYLNKEKLLEGVAMGKGRKKSLVGWTSPKEYKDVHYGNAIHNKVAYREPACCEIFDLWKTSQGPDDIKVKLTIEELK